ncbi:MAG: hypothetical protein ACKVRO_11980 [Micropepsaceae bacterium]
MSDHDHPQRTTPFPFLVAIARAHDMMFVDTPKLLATALPWAVLLTGALVIIAAFAPDTVQSTGDLQRVVILGLIQPVCIAAATAGITLQWQRLILSYKAPISIGTFLRFTARTMAFVFIVGGLYRFIVPAANVLIPGERTGVIALYASIALSALLSARLAPALAAAAIGERKLSFRASWKLTRHCNLRLITAAVFTVAPIQLFLIIFAKATGNFPPPGFPVSHPAHVQIMLAIAWIMSFLSFATFSALTYRYFVLQRTDLSGVSSQAMRETFR